MRMYIATPINGRPGLTLEDKLAAARQRIDVLKKIIRDDERFSGYELTSTFDIAHGEGEGEAEAMGRCIEEVMKSDAIYADIGWENSKGCRLEIFAARLYGKKIYEHSVNFCARKLGNA